MEIRRTLIKSVDSISLSTLADNVVIFHVGSEYDFIFDCPKKTELVTVFSEHVRETTGKPSVTNFKDRFIRYFKENSLLALQSKLEERRIKHSLSKKMKLLLIQNIRNQEIR